MKDMKCYVTCIRIMLSVRIRKTVQSTEHSDKLLQCRIQMYLKHKNTNDGNTTAVVLSL